MHKKVLLQLVVVISMLSFPAAVFANPSSPSAAPGAYGGPHGSDVFVMLVKTDNVGTSAENQFTIPTSNGGYNYSVDCDNDGTFDEVGLTGNYTCNFSTAGTYSVVIDGTFPQIYFNIQHDRNKLLEVQQWGDTRWRNMSSAFSGAEYMQITATDAPDLSLVTRMDGIFNGAIRFNSNINHWDVSNVTHMSTSFWGAEAFNQPLDNWEVGNVISMYRMFGLRTYEFNQDISGWDVSKVTNMREMFFGASSFNQDISGWEVGNVLDMSGMFNGASSFNQDISGWDTSKVTNMSGMFTQASTFNQDISGWNVGSVTNMSITFQNAYDFDQDLSDWDVRNVTNMSGMFFRANAFHQNISGWVTSKVTNMSNMFAWNSRYNHDLGDLDMSSVTNASGMFDYSGISQGTYDATLQGWSTQNLKSNVTLGAYNIRACASEQERQYIIDTFNWTINDGGIGCFREPVFENAVLEVSHDSATLEMTITDAGSEAIYSAGFNIGIDTNYQNNSAWLYNYELGTQSTEIYDLECETTYHYRAFIQTNIGHYYGDDATFTTETCPIMPDLKLDITLNEPGLVQNQDSYYTFTTSNVDGGAYESEAYYVYIVMPDGMSLSGPSITESGEDWTSTSYTDMTEDGGTYLCWDMTHQAQDLPPSFTRHLGSLYVCAGMLQTGRIAPGETHSFTIPLISSAPVDNQTTIRAGLYADDEVGSETFEAAIEDPQGDVFALEINNLAIYSGTQPGSSTDVPLDDSLEDDKDEGSTPSPDFKSNESKTEVLNLQSLAFVNNAQKSVEELVKPETLERIDQYRAVLGSQVEREGQASATMQVAPDSNISPFTHPGIVSSFTILTLLGCYAFWALKIRRRQKI